MNPEARILDEPYSKTSLISQGLRRKSTPELDHSWKSLEKDIFIKIWTWYKEATEDSAFTRAGSPQTWKGRE